MKSEQVKPELHLGKCIKILREENNLTQAQCARRAGISRSRLSQIENHPPKDIRMSTCLKLAWAMKMPVEDLIVSITRYQGQRKPFWR